MVKLFKIVGKRWYFLLLAVIAIICQCWFQLNLPEFMGNIQTIITYKPIDPSSVGVPLLIPVELANPLTNQIVEITHYLSQDELTSLILGQGGWMILCCVIILFCAFCQFYGASTVGAYVGKELRREIYAKVNTLSLADYNKFGTATLITRTTNDIEQIKNYVIMFIRMIVMSPTYMIIALIKTLSLQNPGPKLSIVLAITIPIILGIMIVIFVFAMPLFKQMQSRIDDVTIVLRENLTCIRVIRAYNQQKTETEKFDKVNTNLKNIIVKSGRIMSVANPFIQIIFNFAFICIYAFGFYLLTEIQGTNLSDFQLTINTQVSIIAVVAQYSMQIMNSFLMLAMIIAMIPQAAASYKRVYEVINTKTSINDKEARDFAVEQYELHLKRLEFRFKENYKETHNGSVFSYSLLKNKYEVMSQEEKEKDPQYKDFIEYTNIRKDRESILKSLQDEESDEYINIISKNFNKVEKYGEIEFKNVSFQYPDANTPTIMNISFKTKPGTTTAIIGSTGSGKSTLINLIPRFYDSTTGEILFDGIDIKKIPQKVLREHIGFVPQSAVLFTGTIKENICYGKTDATDEEVQEALRVAQASNFVSKLPDQLDTFVSQGGKNYSGGQKQRLSIARCLVKKPEIYVFDDSFSALDFKTDAALRAQLKTYTKDASVIVVAQRVSSIIDADNIIVLNEGKCVGQGTHAELLSSCEVYQDIVRSQLDPEEVDKTIKMNQVALLEGGNN